MTVEHVRTEPVRRAVAVAPRTARPTTAPTQAPRPQRAPAGPLCLLVPAIAEGDAVSLVRTLRRRGAMRAVLLTRRAGRRDVVSLLGAGVRGAVTAEGPGPRPRAVGAPAAGVDRAGQTGVPDQRGTAAPHPRPAPDLTARELGVLRLVAEGRSNRQIGEALDLSALTVKSHLARISRKIGTGDRAEMVAVAFRHALLS